MAFKFTKGDAVRQVLPAPIAGTVVGYALDQTTGDVTVEVQWLDADGAPHSRFFRDDEIEAQPAA